MTRGRKIPHPSVIEGGVIHSYLGKKRGEDTPYANPIGRTKAFKDSGKGKKVIMGGYMTSPKKKQTQKALTGPHTP